MAEIESRILGRVEIKEDTLYHFKGGILGFEEYDEFYLLNMDADGTFQVLQSKDDKDICFILVDPFTIFKDYKPDIHDDDIAYLELKDKLDILLLTIVTIPNDDFRSMTTNLLGPILFNTKTRKAKQCIAVGDEYTTRHLILAEAQKA